MVCNKCGKELEERSIFCTECGNKISPSKEQRKLGEMVKASKVFEKINTLIERFGDWKINQYLSVAAIISLISIRLFGFMVIAILITIINSLLILHNYKQNAKLDIKMLILSIAVFFVGLLIVI